MSSTSVPHPHNTLLLIDNQVGILSPKTQHYFGSKRSNPSYEESVKKALTAFRSYVGKSPGSGSIIHVYHVSSSAETPLHSSNPETMAIVPDLVPVEGEEVVSKSSSSAMVHTRLPELLRLRGTTNLFVAGLVLDQCISSTIRSARDVFPESGEGAMSITLVGDATATFARGRIDAETVHEVIVECLKEEFCAVCTADYLVNRVEMWTEEGS